MSMVSKWPYAEGFYYIDGRNDVLHITRDAPRDIAERLRRDVEAYIPESIDIFENYETFLKRGISSKDVRVTGIVQD